MDGDFFFIQIFFDRLGYKPKSILVKNEKSNFLKMVLTIFMK